MYVETMREIVLQEMNEERFNRKHIDAKIRKHIESDATLIQKVEEGIEKVTAFLAGTYHASKQKRLQTIQSMDIRTLVMDLFVGVAYFLKAELFTSVSSQLAARLKLSDRTEAIACVAEILAVLCQTDAFDIYKEGKRGSLMLQSRIDLGDRLVEFIENSQYLPPMVCEPLELTHNFSSGYLTHNDSLVLGSGNHHDGDLCLDVLNTMNKVVLSVDTQFLSTVEEEPSFELDSEMKRDNWTAFKKQSYYFYSLLEQQGNRFYLTHKVDKRGRIYACGYHLNTQGTPFKKAMLEFAEPQLVEGVPG